MFVGLEGKEMQQKKGTTARRQQEDSQENFGDRGNAYGWALGLGTNKNITTMKTKAREEGRGFNQ